MNAYKHVLYMAVIVILTFFLWSSDGFAFGDDKQARESLGNIKHIGIVVDWDGAGMKEDKLNSLKEKIGRDIYQGLQQKGIKVRSSDTIDMPPYFYLEIESLKCGDKSYAVYITAKAMQEVILKNRSSIHAISPTWSSGGIIGISDERSIQEVVSALVDEFVAAYLSVNPKDDAETTQ